MIVKWDHLIKADVTSHHIILVYFWKKQFMSAYSYSWAIMNVLRKVIIAHYYCWRFPVDCRNRKRIVNKLWTEAVSRLYFKVLQFAISPLHAKKLQYIVQPCDGAMSCLFILYRILAKTDVQKNQHWCERVPGQE